jgi:uncharacterized protein (TIGR00375 family)
MNWRLSQLDRFTLVSFSDSHSFWPWRIGREATIFDLKKLDYKSIINAIRTKEGFFGTIEVNPAYGKYHFDGHRNCNISLSPKEAIKLNNICPVCGRYLTIGVLHRVEELADREEGFIPKNAKPFFSLIPLSEIIGFCLGIENLYSKSVWDVYNKLIKAFGSEFNVLLNVSKSDLEAVVDEKIANLIIDIREGKVNIEPGYDGVYGKILLNKENKKGLKRMQRSLKDFK